MFVKKIHVIIIMGDCALKNKLSWKMAFGKYKGRDYHNIPKSYLNWLLTLNTLYPGERSKINEVLLEWETGSYLNKRKKV